MVYVSLPEIDNPIYYVSCVQVCYKIPIYIDNETGEIKLNLTLQKNEN
jgi:hypothetical protein